MHCVLNYTIHIIRGQILSGRVREVNGNAACVCYNSSMEVLLHTVYQCNVVIRLKTQ